MGLIARLPRGTFMVSGGLLVNGFASYAFVAIAARNLGPEAYSPVAILWALSFLLGPGIFQPLEQETARAIASDSRRATAPVVRSAGAIAAFTTMPLLVAMGLTAPWILDGVFGGNTWLLFGLFLVVVGLGIAHIVKGVLAGQGRFGSYALYVVGEGVGRLLIVGLLVITLSDKLGSYGLAIGLAPFVGIAVALMGRRGLWTPGPSVQMGELSRALGLLLVASVATALILNAGPLVVEALAGPEQRHEPGRFLNALLVARVPLFFFQAVQAALLTQLSGLAGAGRYSELWRILQRLLVAIVIFGLAAVLLSAIVGPWVVELAFGSDFAVERRDMVLLTTASVGLMIVLSLAQGLIACRSRGRLVSAWLTGLGVFSVVVTLSSDLFLRVELALIASVAVTAVAMAVSLAKRIRYGTINGL